MPQRRKAPFIYSGENLREVAFPLGGVGTGCVSLEGRGALRDWEVFNRPNKGTILPMTFGVVWVGRDERTSGRADEGPMGGGGAQVFRSSGVQGSDPGHPNTRTPETPSPHTSHLTPHTTLLTPHSQARVLQGPRQKDFIGEAATFGGYGHGQIRQQGDGLPHFEDVVFEGKFPFARIRFIQKGFPLEVSLEAWSPFIPGDSRSSGMPVACLTYKLKNTTKERLRVSLAFNLHNAVGLEVPPGKDQKEQATNAFKSGKSCRGLLFTNPRLPKNHPRNGTLALTTDWSNTSYRSYWLRSGWFDSLHDFWDRFTENGELQAFDEAGPGDPVAGALGLHAVIEPGKTAEFPLAITWCFPTAEKYWAPETDGQGKKRPTWTPWYAKEWPTAWDAAEEFFARRKELHAKTRAFEDSMFKRKDLPTEVIESVSATASILRSPTCLRYEDGTFWAWEGCSLKDGCCAGSCTHVWNYALTQAYLFPDLQRSMRRSEYLHSFAQGEEGEKGAIVFRIPLPFNEKPQLWHAASDGQLGGVVQLYRDWKICGDDAYVKEMWPHAKKALEYAWVMWDRDQDGLVEGDQHNTYDINFQGPNPLTQGFYLAALRAGEEISRHLGHGEDADRYRWLFEQGRAKAEKVLFNGEYFEQAFDVLAPDAPKYQHGKGCLSDQLFGQWSAHVAGLGYLYDPKKVKSALKAIHTYNFKDPLGDHANMQRIYATADEPGLILCSWPRGGRPRFPFVYSDEVWTGIEYQVASHMVFEGLPEEGLDIVRGIRLRHDGRRRNPYNEFECGSHYARAMAAWGLMVALEKR